MASTYTDIGTELMTTGENAGNWGTKTNTNLKIIEEAVRGYVAQSIAGGADTTALTYTDGSTGDAARNMVIALTGSITGNQVVTVTAKEKVWIVDNQTSGAYTVQFMVSGQTGVTWAATDKGTKILYCNGTDVIDTGITSAGAFDLDGKELILDADADTSLTADTDDQIDIKIAGTDQLTIKDGALSPVTTNDIDLGTASLEFKDAYFDGTVTSDAFAGPLTGNVTGNASGTAATVTTAAQSNITSLGTLTTLTVDNVITNGATIGHTSDTDLITLADGAVTVAGTIGSGAITSTGIVTGTAFTAGSAVLAEAELELLDGLTAGTAIASKVVTTDSSIDTTGQRNLTISGELDAATLDISSSIDIAGASQFSGAVTVGVDDTGLDVKLFGASAGAYLEWDESADQLRIMGASADATTSTGKLLLATSLTNINASDVIGKIDFQAPHESGGTDAITVAASIQAMAQGTFSASVNATDLLFFTGHSEAATEKFRFTSQGEIGVGGANYGTDGQILTSGGAGAAPAWEDSPSGAVTAINNATANELVTIGATTTELEAEANLTFDGTDVLVGGSGKLQLRDTGLYIHSSTDGQLDLIADTEIQIAATTVDLNGILDVSGVLVAGGQISAADGTAGAPSISNTGDLNTGLLFSAADTMAFSAGGTSQFTMADGVIAPVTDSDVDLGTSSLEFKDGYFDGTLYADAINFNGTAISSTAAEINYSDLATLGTSAASKVLTADANNLSKITGAIYIEEATLSFDATQDWDVRASPVAKVTLTNNVTFDAPTNPTTGQFISIVCIQDGTGSRTIAWNAVFEFATDTTPTATTTASKGDMFNFRYNGAKWLEVGRNLALTLS